MKYLIIACIALSMLPSCSSSRNAAAQLNSLNGDWQLTVFPAGSKSFAEMFTMKTPELQFIADGRRVAGSTGCNRVAGSFAVNGEEFHFNNLASTKMGCPNYDETTYIDALNRVNRFRLNADQLSLYQDSVLLMTFARKAGGSGS